MNKRVTHKQQSKTIHKERGIWLSAALVLLLLRNIVGAIGIFYLRGLDDLETPAWAIALLGLTALADVVAALAMWYWKKWGLTLFGISTVVGIAVGIVLVGPWYAFYGILFPAILAYILTMQKKYQYFE